MHDEMKAYYNLELILNWMCVSQKVFKDRENWELVQVYFVQQNLCFTVKMNKPS